MQNFVRKIKIDETLNKLFLSFLLNEKYQVPPLSAQQENLISHISGQFLVSGFLLKSCNFSLSNKSLIDRVKYQRRIQLLKQMSVTNDLNNIARNLNEKNIDHVFLKGVALNSDGIYPSGIRFSRDIDLLVRPDLLSEAYDVLKALGYKYLNLKTQDSVTYHYFGLHFPPMINENNTKVELHWRVTNSVDFKNCPFMDKILFNRRISNTNPYIFCPEIEMTIAHIVHHSFDQHRMNLGPMFLFDLAGIFNFFDKQWPIDNRLHKQLGIEKKFELCRTIIERLSNESIFSAESILMLNQIFKHSHWLRLSDGPQSSSSSVNTTRIENLDSHNFLLKLLFKARNTRTLYQVSYYSAKFWLFFVSDIFIFLKKVMRPNSN